MTVPTSPPMYSTSVCWVLSFFFFFFFWWGGGGGGGGGLHFASSIYWILCYVWHLLLAVPISSVHFKYILDLIFEYPPFLGCLHFTSNVRFQYILDLVLCLNIPFGCPCFISSVHFQYILDLIFEHPPFGCPHVTSSVHFQYILDLVSFLSIPFGCPHVTSCVHFQCTLSSAHFGTCPLAASTSLPMYTSVICQIFCLFVLFCFSFVFVLFFCWPISFHSLCWLPAQTDFVVAACFVHPLWLSSLRCQWTLSVYISAERFQFAFSLYI